MLNNIIAVLLFMAFLAGIVLIQYACKRSDNLGSDSSPLDNAVGKAPTFWHPED